MEEGECMETLLNRSADPIKVFIGYDSREIPAYHVLSQSIIANSSVPVTIAPLNLRHLEAVFWRKRDPKQSTEFSFSRFLVPYLSGYTGWSVFMDSDMLLSADVASLWELRDEQYAVMVVKHDYVPQSEVKFLGETQTRYPKKNWSSLMLFNNAKCRALTVDYVNQASGLELHQFKWLKDESLIGGLPLEWNYLVGEYPAREGIKNLHYTLGGPWWDEFKSCDYSSEWFSYWRQTTTAARTAPVTPAVPLDDVKLRPSETVAVRV
jgi:hypothetical protein